MTYKLQIFASCLLIFIFACGKIPATGQNGTSTFKPDILQKAQDQLCSQGQVLKEIPEATNTSFSNLTLRSLVFAFSIAKDVDCVTTTNINEAWAENGANLRFNFNLNSNCLKNNSIWKVVGNQVSGFDQYFDLESIGDPDRPPRIQMNAHQAVSGTYVRDRVGLKILGCFN